MLNESSTVDEHVIYSAVLSSANAFETSRGVRFIQLILVAARQRVALADRQTDRLIFLCYYMYFTGYNILVQFKR